MASVAETSEATQSSDRRDLLMRIIDALAKAEVFEVRMFGGEFTVFKYWRNIIFNNYCFIV